MSVPATREEAVSLDGADRLARERERFVLPEGVIYLDGNSLGPPTKASLARLDRVARGEWAGDLIKSWNTHGWIDLPLRVGDKIGRLIGAQPGETVVADSTSVNLFKVLAAASRLAADRSVILSQDDNFPTDLYIAQGLIELGGGRHRLRTTAEAEIARAIDSDTAIVLLTHVNYRTGAMHDLATLTAAAHAKGALVIWDLAHSVGAVPVDLGAAKADFAVGCGYKFLNGGPGAPAFVWVARRHQERFTQPLSGWLGHAQPFAFAPGYAPAPGVARFLCGTPPILSLAALEEGVDAMLAVEPQRLRAKSIALGDALIGLVEARCARLGLELVSPRDGARRGSQVSLSHPRAHEIMQALIARGVIGDFRPPDILRFGLAPLYLRFADIWDAVEALGTVMRGREFDDPRHGQRAKVT
jgi:kynureninase